MRLHLTLDGNDSRADPVETIYELPEAWAPSIIGLLDTIKMFHGVNPNSVQLRLEDCGRKKIAVIKDLRAAFGYSLKEAKAVADRAPTVLDPLDPLSAQQLASELRDSGATVSGGSAIDRLAALLGNATPINANTKENGA